MEQLLFFTYPINLAKKGEKKLPPGVSKPPKFLNDPHLSTRFETYYHAASVKYSGYLVLSWWS